MRALVPVLILLVACARPVAVPGPSNDTPMADSTFKVRAQATVVIDGESIDGGWSGTAWIAGYDGADALLVTAGHVCDSSDVGEITALAFSLLDQNGGVFPATVVRFTVDPAPDLCLLRAYLGRFSPPALGLAAAMPDYGDPVQYVGAPSGVFGGGMAPLYRGYYAGANLVSIPTAPGASGSAMLSPAGVIGVLVAVDRRFNGLTYFEPLDHLRAFLAP